MSTTTDAVQVYGISLDDVVPCGRDDCDDPATILLVQKHLRPPLACLRLPLCEPHRQEVLAGEQQLIRASHGIHGHARLICTIHSRSVEPRARWESL